MALNRKPNPTGADKLVDRWQKLIYDNLADRGWLGYESYPRGYENVDSKDENKVKAQRFMVGNDYRPLTMDDNFNVTSFFLVSDTGANGSGLTESTISLIVQSNLKKLYPNAPDTSRFDEELINDIKAASRNLDGRFTEGAISRTIDDVYREFDTTTIKKKVNNHDPYNVVRFDMSVVYQHDCGDEYARGDCTIRVDSVTTTPETSTDADDGTATVNYSGDQGNVTFLWNDPLAQTTQTAIDLAPNPYTVTISDDNAISCTAQGSGTVEAGTPIPECNLVIESITTVGTTVEVVAGTATAVVSGNVGAVNFAWEDSEGNTQTSNPATSLPVGVVSLAVSDSGVGVTCIKSSSERVPNSNGNYLFLDSTNDWADLGSQVVESGDWFFMVEFNANDFSLRRNIFSGTNSYEISIENSTTVRVKSNNIIMDFTVSAMSIHTWNHLMVTNENSSGELRVYLNNVESSSGALSGGSMRISRVGALAAGSRQWGRGLDNFGMSDVLPTPAERAGFFDMPATFATVLGTANVNPFYNMAQTGDAPALIDLGDSGNDATLSIGYLPGALRFETRDEL